ncbi:MAG: sulfotransferase [Alterinioella nitratireducens]|uniref:sulfotransferase n=1 Tax=Alterinioella nitratireducens TaxID=2735915 RepID=UPI0040581D0D
MFFCIGAQKAGTSWLYDLLRRSPECHFGRNKEMHYFDVMAGKAMQPMKTRLTKLRTHAERLQHETGPVNRAALEQLRNLTELLTIYTGPTTGPKRHLAYLDSLLGGRSTETLICDITPAYSMLDAPHFADMASIGAARFVFILREPVARMWSQMRMAVRLRDLSQEGDDASYAEACNDQARRILKRAKPTTLGRSDYARTMAELEAAVPADRIMYVFYERLFEPETVAQICDFLGIAPIAPDADRQVNPGRSAPIPEDIARGMRTLLDHQYIEVARRFDGDLPAAWNRAPGG